MNRESKCTLSDSDLLAKVEWWVHKLAETGGKAWSLRVPVDFNYDPDMVVIELANRYRELLNSTPNPEVSDTTGADSSTSADPLISSLPSEVSDLIIRAEAEAKHRASQHNYTTWQHDAKWFVKGVKWTLEQVADTTPELADKLKRVEGCSNARKAEILRLRDEVEFHFSHANDLAKEVEQLRSWKAQALASTPDWQAIGGALNLKLGTSVSEQVLPAILNLLKDRRELVLTLRRLQSYCLHYVKAYEKTGRCQEVEEALSRYHQSTVEP